MDEEEEFEERDYPRTNTEGFLNVAMRIPPILFLDNLCMGQLAVFPSLYVPGYEPHLVNKTTAGLTLEGVTESYFNKSYVNTSSLLSAATVANVANTAAAASIPVDKGEDFDYTFLLGEFTKVFINWNTLVEFFSYTIWVLVALSIFLLRFRRLVNMYKVLFGLTLLCASYTFDKTYLAFYKRTQPEGVFAQFFGEHNDFYALACSLVVQICLAKMFALITDGVECYFWSHTKALQFYIFPLVSIASAAYGSRLSSVPNFVFFFVLSSFIVTSMTQLKVVVLDFWEQLRQMFECMRNFGFYALFEEEYERLDVTSVFRLFWLLRVFWHSAQLMSTLCTWQDIAEATLFTSLGSDFTVPLKLLHPANFWYPLNWSQVVLITKYLLVRGCETCVAVVGMTSVLSAMITQLGDGVSNFLPLDDADDRAIGTVSGVLFFILALQNGLTGMVPEKRMMRLYRNFCLIFTAILHFIHNRVSPIMYTLSASRNPSPTKHARVLIVCASVIVSSIVFLNYIWTHHTLSTWLFAVTAFSVEIIIKVIISLIVYTLFMIDALRSSMWEQLDDYIYYIRAMGNSIEFFFGICLFLNGTFILIFESGGLIRAVMMIIHAYYNIYLQAKEGWKSFSKRRLAAHKINSLAEATPSQLEAFDDVCAICYQELNTARITKCNHYFHSICLRKWLYLQDICPLCHKLLHNIGKKKTASSSAAREQQQQQPQQQQQQGQRPEAEEVGNVQQQQQQQAATVGGASDAAPDDSQHGRRSVGIQAGPPNGEPWAAQTTTRPPITRQTQLPQLAQAQEASTARMTVALDQYPQRRYNTRQASRE